jgi:hypothetical protein
MMLRESRVEGVVDDIDDSSVMWPKLTASSVLFIKHSLDRLLEKHKSGQALTDEDFAKAYYDATATSGFPEFLIKDSLTYVLVPFKGNAFLYCQHSKGQNYYARMYKRANAFITVAKSNGDFYEVNNSVDRIVVSKTKLQPA